MLPVAILAGGLATRLRPVSETVPKSMLVVAGKPFVAHQLDWLHGEGVRRVVLCVGHLGDAIRDAIGDGASFGLGVEYSFDGEPLLGTGGALRKAAPMLGREFFVLYGDSYIRCSLAAVESAFRRQGKPALMTVLQNDGRWDRSNVLFRDGRLVRYDKRTPSPDMRHIDYGLSMLSAGALASHGEGEAFDLADLMMDLSRRSELAGYEATERFYEIGSPAGLRETEEFFLNRNRI
ncbi:MAG: nucleotidyltransferase family protein [Terriglobia bacterium]